MAISRAISKTKRKTNNVAVSRGGDVCFMNMENVDRTHICALNQLIIEELNGSSKRNNIDKTKPDFHTAIAPLPRQYALNCGEMYMFGQSFTNNADSDTDKLNELMILPHVIVQLSVSHLLEWIAVDTINCANTNTMNSLESGPSLIQDGLVMEFPTVKRHIQAITKKICEGIEQEMKIGLEMGIKTRNGVNRGYADSHTITQCESKFSGYYITPSSSVALPSTTARFHFEMHLCCVDIDGQCMQFKKQINELQYQSNGASSKKTRNQNGCSSHSSVNASVPPLIDEHTLNIIVASVDRVLLYLTMLPPQYEACASTGDLQQDQSISDFSSCVNCSGALVQPIVHVHKAKNASDAVNYILHFQEICSEKARNRREQTGKDESQYTLLHAVKKKKMQKKPVENENEITMDLIAGDNKQNANANSAKYPMELLSKLQDNYVRLLMVTPGMSETKARHLMSYYSCPKHLYEALTDTNLTVEERRNCLQYKFHPTQKYVKLSNAVYDCWVCAS